MKKWYVVLKDIENFKAGTRVEMTEGEAAALVANGTLKGPFTSQAEALSWKPETGEAPQPPAAPRSQLEESDLRREAARIERDRVFAILETARALGLPDETARAQIDSGASVEAAKAAFTDALVKANGPIGRLPAQPNGTTVSAQDQIGRDAANALLLRAFSGSTNYEFTDPRTQGLPQAMHRRVTHSWLPEGQRIDTNTRQLSHLTLTDLGRRCLGSMGVRNVHDLPADLVAQLMLSTPWQNQQAWAQLRELSGFVAAGDFHTPAHFPNIMRDAMNKRMRAGYEMAATTYQVWAVQKESVADYKTINFPILGETQDLEEVPDDEAFVDVEVRDSNQTAVARRYGRRWSLTPKAIRNDDRNALTVIPPRLGDGARRTLNRQVYQPLFDNPSIDSGNGAGNLFNTDALTTAGGHKNDLGAGDVTVANLNTVYANMALQQGLDSSVYLNIGFRYILHSQAKRGTVLQVLNSQANPTDVSNVPQYNAGTANIWQGGFVPVAEALIDANNSSGWYAVADGMLIDTIGYGFMTGYETPIIESDYDFETKGQRSTIEWVFFVVLLDHRGLHRAGI